MLARDARGTCPVVAGVWASIELLVCVLFASSSHPEPSFDLLEITVRIPLASQGLLKSYRVSSPEYAMLAKGKAVG